METKGQLNETVLLVMTKYFLTIMLNSTTIILRGQICWHKPTEASHPQGNIIARDTGQDAAVWSPESPEDAPGHR